MNSEDQGTRHRPVTNTKVSKIQFNFRSRKDCEDGFVINVTNQVNKSSKRFGSLGLLNQPQLKSYCKDGVKFIGEMKKHGIYDAFNDINKFSEFLGALPNKTEET